MYYCVMLRTYKGSNYFKYHTVDNEIFTTTDLDELNTVVNELHKIYALDDIQVMQRLDVESLISAKDNLGAETVDVYAIYNDVERKVGL